MNFIEPWFTLAIFAALVAIYAKCWGNIRHIFWQEKGSIAFAMCIFSLIIFAFTTYPVVHMVGMIPGVLTGHLLLYQYRNWKQAQETPA